MKKKEKGWSLRSFRSRKKNQKLKSIEEHFPKGIRNDEFNNEIDEIKKWEEKIKQKKQ